MLNITYVYVTTRKFHKSNVYQFEKLRWTHKTVLCKEGSFIGVKVFYITESSLKSKGDFPAPSGFLWVQWYKIAFPRKTEPHADPANKQGWPWPSLSLFFILGSQLSIYQTCCLLYKLLETKLMGLCTLKKDTFINAV